MTRVWSHCKSGSNSGLLDFNEFTDDNVNGWNYCKNFETLGELINWLHEQRLVGRISRLVLNSHGGGGGGKVELDRALTLSSLPQFAGDLRRLAEFMDRSAERRRPKLIFTGCSTGADNDGTDFLRAISEIFVDVNVIAFEMTSLQVSSTYQSLAPGDIWITGYPVRGENRVRTGPFHPASKWVRNSILLRYPSREQHSHPNNRCAYPRCPGHRHEYDQCDGSWHRGCQWPGTPKTTPVYSVMDHLPPEANLPEPRWYRRYTPTVQTANRGFTIPGPQGTRTRH